MENVQTQSDAEPSEDLAIWVEERSTILMWALIGIGVLLVVCSTALGQMAVEHCTQYGNCSWSTDEAHEAALNCRILGGMLFAAGLVERIVIGLRGLRRPAV